MNSTISGKWTSKQIGLLALIVLIPTAALAYLSIRSVQSDAIATEHLLIEGYAGLARLAADEFRSEFSQAGQLLFEELDQETMLQEDQLSRVISRFEDDERLRGLVFAVDDAGRLVYPRLGVGSEVEPGFRFQAAFAAAEEAELASGDLKMAKRSYSKAVQLAAAPFEKVLALNGLARCEFKLNPESSFDTYSAIIEEGADHPNADQPYQEFVRYSLIAYLQQVQILDTTGKKTQGVRQALEAYRYLAQHRLALSFDGAAFYQQELEAYLVSQAGSGDTDQLEAIRTTFQTRHVPGSVWSQVKVLASTALQSALSGSITSRTLETPEGVYLLISNPLPLEAGERRVLVGFLWSETEILRTAANVAKTMGSRTELQFLVSTLGGRVIYPAQGGWENSEGVRWVSSEAIEGLRFGALPIQGTPHEIARQEVRSHLVFVGVICAFVVSFLALGTWALSRELTLSRMRSGFVAGVSHELKTPLSLIRLYAENLRSGWVSEAKKNRYYDLITQETERLSNLVENALSMARIEAGTQAYVFKSHDLAETVKGSAERFRTQIQEAGITLNTNIPSKPVICCLDREAVEQVLANLIQNAVKYIGDGPEKKVAVRLVVNGRSAAIQVEDTGIGIPGEEHTRVFEKFQRGSGSSIASGSGIGLTLVRHIVKAHGGRIKLYSKPGNGTTVEILLPLQPSGDSP